MRTVGGEMGYTYVGINLVLLIQFDVYIERGNICMEILGSNHLPRAARIVAANRMANFLSR